MDNWKLQIRAADCDYLNTELTTLTDRQKQAYAANCINVSAGEKAQIRIANPWTSFNITNQATFENIEFTGEDLFASAHWQTSTQTYNIMGQWNYLAYMPFRKCRVRDDPDKLTTLDQLHIETLDYVPIEGFTYECINPFDTEKKKPPMEYDERCFTPEYIVNPNSANCTGEPYNDDFFQYSEANDQFSKRHKTLFNLYAFDSLRTKNTKAP